MALPRMLEEGGTTEVVRRLRERLESRPEVVLAYLFGSLARGRPSPLSDVDVAVLVRNDAFFDDLDLWSDLADALETDAVDLVVLNRADPSLAHRVARDDQVLICRDERMRLSFVRQAILRFLDTALLREAARRSILLWATRGRSHG